MFYDEFIKLCNSVSKSPTAVAKEIGFTGAHVTKWKNGSTPTDATIFKICDYFGIAHDYFSACEKEKAPTGTGERMSDDELKVALFGSLDIDDADLDDVKRYAAFVRDKKRGK